MKRSYLGSITTWLTSFPVAASMSRNSSTRARTSLAALALLTWFRNGRVNLIKPANSETLQGETICMLSMLKLSFTHSSDLITYKTAVITMVENQAQLRGNPQPTTSCCQTWHRATERKSTH